MTERRFLYLLFYLLVCAAGIFLLLRYLLPVLLPFLLALGLCRLAEPVTARLSRRLPRALASFFVLLFLFLLLGLLIYLLLQACGMELSRLSRQLPALLQRLQAPAGQLKDRLLQLADRVPDGLGLTLRAWIEQLFSGTAAWAERLSSLLFGLASSAAEQVPRALLFFMTLLVASFMLGTQRPALLQLLKKRLPAAFLDRARQLQLHLKQAMGGWLQAQLRLIFVMFLLLSLGLWILGLRAPVLLGAAIALVDALPILGTGTVLIPWALINLLQQRRALGFGLLLLYGLCLAARTGLEPRIVGRQIGLNPLLSLFAMYAGFRLFGVAGMILLPILTVFARQIWVYGRFGELC